NQGFDVWIICDDVTSLPITQECFPARRVSDSYTLSYCPFGIEGGMITESRPVYSIGCCGCGCPDDELYMEFFPVKPDPGNPGTWLPVDCNWQGDRITVRLSQLPPDPEAPTVFRYEGFFCKT